MRRLSLVAFAVCAILAARPAAAQQQQQLTQQQKYNYCHAAAVQQSGWNGSTQNPNSKSVARGGAVGAGTGALIGSMGGGNGWQGAAIGAAFGLVAGEARRNRGAQQVQNQQNNYYNILNSCLQS